MQTSIHNIPLIWHYKYKVYSGHTHTHTHTASRTSKMWMRTRWLTKKKFFFFFYSRPRKRKKKLRNNSSILYPRLFPLVLFGSAHIFILLHLFIWLKTHSLTLSIMAMAWCTYIILVGLKGARRTKCIRYAKNHLSHRCFFVRCRAPNRWDKIMQRERWTIIRSIGKMLKESLSSASLLIIQLSFS